jgi:hypothetical protein
MTTPTPPREPLDLEALERQCDREEKLRLPCTVGFRLSTIRALLARIRELEADRDALRVTLSGRTFDESDLPPVDQLTASFQRFAALSRHAHAETLGVLREIRDAVKAPKGEERGA